MQKRHTAGARASLAQEPGNPWRASDLANALWLEDELAEALSWARWATHPAAAGQSGVHPMSWRCLGNVLLDLGRYAEADQAYRWSDPGGVSAITQFNRSKVALGAGAFTLAWPLAEARLDLEPAPKGVLAGPWWEGWPDCPTVSVWSEQGFGDTLQFVRWVPALLARGMGVRLLVQPALVRMLQQGLAWLGPGLEVLSKPEADLELGASGLCHGSLLSLPWRLGVAEPPWPKPNGYLSFPGQLRHRKRPRLGLLWGAGRYLDGQVCERDYWRKSVLGAPLLELLTGLAERPLQLVKLQVGADRSAADAAGAIWAETLDPEGDFLALAELMQSLDLVISVDTAGAHLAGALGRPTWMLLPWAAECRWQRDSQETLWYPGMRLWRQPVHGNWSALWPRLLEELDCWLNCWNRAL